METAGGTSGDIGADVTGHVLHVGCIVGFVESTEGHFGVRNPDGVEGYFWGGASEVELGVWRIGCSLVTFSFCGWFYCGPASEGVACAGWDGGVCEVCEGEFVGGFGGGWSVGLGCWDIRTTIGIVGYFVFEWFGVGKLAGSCIGNVGLV